MPRGTGRTNPTSRASGEETKSQIIDAALMTLRTVGYAGTSARAIARTGNFNQALIFYHFGSVNQLLLEALDRVSSDRMARYEAALTGVSSLAELVSVASRLHWEDQETGQLTILTNMLSGATADPLWGREVLARFAPWERFAEQALEDAIAGTQYGKLPTGDIALAVTALFVGIEMLTQLDEDRDRTESLFRTIGLVASLIESVIGVGQPKEAK